MSQNETTQVQSQISSGQQNKIPEFKRDIFPTNIALSAADICELAAIIKQSNDEAIKLELETVDREAEDRQERVNGISNLMQVKYILRASNGDEIVGLEIPAEDDLDDYLSTFYISSEEYARLQVNQTPLNHVSALLSFKQPSLKLDWVNPPSNPTENTSVINIVGRNENWVRATAGKLEDFFDKKKTIRPVIHGSGAYDYLLFLLFLPAIIGLLAKYDTLIFRWAEEKSQLFNVVLGIYFLLLTLLFAHIVFKIVRWVFPPIEYYKVSNKRATGLRAIVILALGTLLLSGLYDFLKYFITILF
tara:strand:- start:94931 stop:95842 length:912 start_codon:yes stop_codon:yes gene_type:complete